LQLNKLTGIWAFVNLISLTKAAKNPKIMGSFLSVGGVEEMVKDLKSVALRLLLEYLKKHVPLSKAVVASLGGEGREAKIWQEVGIAAENGWLIERNRKKSRKLISEMPYRYTSTLESFSRVFRNVGGAKAGIDAFHLDLCGTLDSSIAIVRRIIPLVIKTQGRLLAVTVADARRNVGVEQFGHIEKILSKLLGFRYERLRERLLIERLGDRQLAVMRELVFFHHMTELFKFYGRYTVPSKVTRLAYISHTSGAGFPMRTYLFRFEKEPRRMTAKKFAGLLYDKWLDEKLADLNKPASESAATKETTMSEDTKPMKGEFGKLRALVQVIGGEALDEFEALVAAATRERSTLLDELRALISLHDDGTVPAVVTTEQPVRTGKRAAAIAAAKPVDAELIEAQLYLMRARAKGPKQLESAKAEIMRRFRMGRKGNRGAKVGGLLAVTQGKRRPQFLRRLHKHDPTAINEDLAGLYTAILGKDTKLSDLRREAGL